MKNFLKWYVKYHFVLAVCNIPPYGVNLGVVFLFAKIHLELFWILSSVVVGDIIAYEINLALGLWLQTHWKYLRNLQMERFQ